MTLATAILQPYALSRDTSDPWLGLMEDVTRLMAIFAEDALADGPLAGEAEGALDDVGQTIITWFTAADGAGQTRQAKVLTRLNGRFAPIRALVEGLLDDTSAVEADPGLIFDLIRQLFDLLKGVSEATTLPAIRAELEFARSLIEDDLGFGPAFLSARITEYITVLRGRLTALPAPTDANARRRIQLARVTLARLGLRANLLVPPTLDTEPIARAIHGLFQSSGLPDILRELDCALDGIQTALEAALAAKDAVVVATEPVGAGVVPTPNAKEYSYFASFVLQNEDLPLIGLAELDDSARFVTQFRDSDVPVIAALRGTLTEVEGAALAAYTSGEPDKALLLTLLAGLNRAIQSSPILDLGDEPLIEEVDLQENLRELRDDYLEDQDLFLYNRRVLENVFVGLDDLSANSTRGFGRLMASTFQWPHHQVFVTGDRKFVMCDDMPIHSGTDVKWFEAPIFAGSIRGGMWFSFEHAKPEFCELWAQVWFLLAEAGKAIWHTILVQPGHEAQNASVCAIEYADLVQQFLFGKPVSAHLIEGGPHTRRWGKSLDSFLGLKGIATFASTFQGIQNAPQEVFLHWLTMLGGDIFRTLGPISMMNNVRDVMVGFVVLLNFGGPRDGPSTLPSNPARNHQKQEPFVALSDSLMAMALVSLLPQDNYSIEIFNPNEGNIRDRRVNVFVVHMIAGGAGFGLLAGMAGSLVAQIIAWAEDFPRFFKTGGISAAKMVGFYLFYMYIFKENATEGGEYRPGGANFRGYPDRETSPYLLPFPAGVERYCGQGNLGLFSHNRISNTDFTVGGVNAVQQTYAYDFDHHFQEPIACCRAGTIVAIQEGMLDSTTGPWNSITIRHNVIDNEHDNFGAGPVQTYTVYGHLAFNGVRNAPLFGGAVPAIGTAVNQGDLIALAGDTGTSFHNHLHMHVVPDDGAGNPSTVFAIPFVFRDMRVGQLPRGSFLNDGNCKSTTWYRSRNG